MTTVPAYFSGKMPHGLSKFSGEVSATGFGLLPRPGVSEEDSMKENSSEFVNSGMGDRAFQVSKVTQNERPF